jgi:hypothetical protein
MCHSRPRSWGFVLIGLFITCAGITTGVCAENRTRILADIPTGRALYAEHIAYTRISVPEGLGGPAREACRGDFAVMAMGPNGSMFVAEPQNAQVHWISSEGTDYIIAGTGEKGFRDGPGDQAKFDFGYRAYNDLDIKTDQFGNVYVSDMMNKRLRKLTKHTDGSWHVTTVSGGGTLKTKAVSKSSWVKATDLEEGCATNFAVTHDGKACYFAGAGGIWKIVVDEKKAMLIADGDDLRAAGLKQFRAGHVGGAHVTTDGIFFWMPNGGKEIWSLNETSGEIKRYAGGGLKRMDGKGLLDSGFHTVFAVYSPNAGVIYTGGGDEFNVRRIFAGEVRHLYKDGVFRPVRQKAMLKEAWELGSVKAIDAQGRLYSTPSPYSWPSWMVRTTFSNR